MSRRITAILAHDESVTTALVAAHIPDDAGIELVTIVDSLFLTADDVRAADADALIIACSEHSEDGLALIEWWHEVRPGRPVLVFSRDGDHSFVQRVFAAGADDVLVLNPGPHVPEQTRHDVEFSIRKAVARNFVGAERSADAGSLIPVLGPKGGTGKTVTSTNLAVALAQRGRRTVLVDLDLQFGDVALALGLIPEVTSFDLAVSGGSLDAEKLDDFLLRHPSGLRVLAAPVRPDQAASVRPEMILDVFDLLRREYDFVIVDTPPAFDPEVIATIDSSTSMVMIAMLDALSLKNTRLGLETLDLMAVPQDKVHVILNRSDSSIGLSEADAITILGRRPDVMVPSDRDVPRSLAEAVPLVVSNRKSEVARAYEGLADLLSAGSEESVAAEPKARRTRRRGLRRRGRGANHGEIVLSTDV
jgi:pilus assembly protein CpaE